MVGGEDNDAILKKRYHDVVQDGTVNKVTFVFILQEEHRRLGFSFKE